MSGMALNIRPEHTFRYVSEWDPRKKESSKGGYLEGTIKLPAFPKQLRVTLSTCAGTNDEVHPNILHLVRKDQNSRLKEKETVPNWRHWQLHLLIKDNEAGGRSVFVSNQRSDLDKGREKDIPDEDFLFNLDPSNCLQLGKDLKVVILFPKNDKRSKDGELTVSQILLNRISNEETRKETLKKFSDKNSSNLKRVHIKCDVFDMVTSDHLDSDTSKAIVDKYRSLHIKYVKPATSCERGGREIVVVSEQEMVENETINPSFQLFDQNDIRMKSDEHRLNQPVISDVVRDKRCVRFISPHQPNFSDFQQKQWKIKLILKRGKDSVQSEPVVFTYLQHLSTITSKNGQDTCIFCSKDFLQMFDGPPPGVNLTINKKTGPGIKRRRLTLGEDETGGAANAHERTIVNNFNTTEITETNVLNYAVNVEPSPSASDYFATWSSIPTEQMSPSQDFLNDEGQKDLSKLMLPTDPDSSLNTPEAEIENLNPFSFDLDTIQTDGANPKQTLKENATVKNSESRDRNDLRSLIVKCFFGNDREAQQVFGVVPSRRRYGLKDKIEIFLKHCPYFFHIFFLLLVLFYLFPVTFQQVTMIIVAIIVALSLTFYENLCN